MNTIDHLRDTQHIGNNGHAILDLEQERTRKDEMFSDNAVKKISRRCERLSELLDALSINAGSKKEAALLEMTARMNRTILLYEEQARARSMEMKSPQTKLQHAQGA